MGQAVRFISMGVVCWVAAGAMAQAPPGTPPPPPPVTLVEVQPHSVPLVFSYVGTTAASKLVEVRARVNGYIETRDFEEGAFVKEGDTLFTIDKRSFEADREVARAQVEQAEARLKLSEQELKRLSSVAVPGAIAETDVDRQRADRADAAAALHLAKANLAKAELQVSYTKVSAPLSGFIGKTQKEIGAYVEAGTNNLLATVQQVDPIYVSARVSEREFLGWRAAAAAGTQALAESAGPYLEITFEDGAVYPEHGRLNFEAAALDTNTGTVEIRAQFANPDHRIKVGQFVKVSVRGWQRANALTVPQRAVGQTPQGSFVYVVGADNKAEMRPVTPGQWTGDAWIIDKGLKPGERVIADGTVKVMPGATVAPAADTPAPAAK